MSQDTAFGAAELTTYIRVDKADERVFYFRIVGDQLVEITADEYRKENA